MFNKKMIITFVLLLIIATKIIVYADEIPTPVYPGSLSSGITNISYWYEGSLNMQNYYASKIVNAANDWNTKSSKISTFYKANNVLTSRIDFYVKSNGFYILNSNILALTQMYATKDGTSNLGNPQDGQFLYDWNYVKVFINNSTMLSITANGRQGTLAHEIGHALGLSHSTNNNSIMSTYANRNVQTVQNVDITALHGKY